MKKAILGALALIFVTANLSFGAPLRFEKLSEHCYYLQAPEQENVAAIVTDEGILIINPPAESWLPDALDALERLSAKPVRWVAFTDLHYARNAGAKYFSERGAVLLAGAQFRALSKKLFASSETKMSSPWMFFNRQMHLFPAGLEIRIIAVQSKARTGSDIVVFVPAEKVLFTGALYQFPYYPEIDMEFEGDALGWIDGMKQVIAAVPLLKLIVPSKIAATKVKVQPNPEQEKTLEEGVIVVSGYGISNLQNMKDVLELAQKLQAELSRRVQSGRVCEDFLPSIGAEPYRKFGNLDGYLSQLCAAIQNASDER